jgi:hypothetical protein
MTLSAVKEKLHEYIDHADAKKIQAIYTLIENDIEDAGYIYHEDTLNMLEERQEEYLKGNSEGLTVEESMEHVKQELKKRGL